MRKDRWYWLHRLGILRSPSHELFWGVAYGWWRR